MIGRRFRRSVKVEEVEPKWFDDFDMRLGDMMRGERATLGKSLLDVQRELRIKASYIAAIENADPTAFETPGFIAGYVRSYARYLNMDPDTAYASFCKESGFETAHGMSAAASTMRKSDVSGFGSGLGTGLGSGLGAGLGAQKTPSMKNPFGSDNNPFGNANTGFGATSEGALARIEPGAIGSTLVLVALISALGFGGWSVLNEIQRVQLAPVENTPDVLADLDPLAGVAPLGITTDTAELAASGVFSPPSTALDRLYRPQALDVPVMVARDAPISTLDPASIGSFASQSPTPYIAHNATANSENMAGNMAANAPQTGFATPQVVAAAADDIVLFATRAAWVRVRSADGTVIFEKTMDAGEEFILPATADAPTLQAGMAGSLYFEIDGDLFGPAGPGTSTVRALPMSRDALLENFALADLSQDPVLAKVIALAETETLRPAQE